MVEIATKIGKLIVPPPHALPDTDIKIPLCRGIKSIAQMTNGFGKIPSKPEGTQQTTQHGPNRGQYRNMKAFWRRLVKRTPMHRLRFERGGGSVKIGGRGMLEGRGRLKPARVSTWLAVRQPENGSDTDNSSQLCQPNKKEELPEKASHATHESTGNPGGTPSGYKNGHPQAFPTYGECWKGARQYFGQNEPKVFPTQTPRGHSC